MFDPPPPLKSPEPKLTLAQAIDILRQDRVIAPVVMLELLERIQRGVQLMREQATAAGFELETHRQRAQVQRDEEIGRMGGGG
jgi:hypothetical protein